MDLSNQLMDLSDQLMDLSDQSIYETCPINQLINLLNQLMNLPNKSINDFLFPLPKKPAQSVNLSDLIKLLACVAKPVLFWPVSCVWLPSASSFWIAQSPTLGPKFFTLAAKVLLFKSC